MLKKVILAGLLVVSGANAGMFDSVVSAVGGVRQQKLLTATP